MPLAKPQQAVRNSNLCIMFGFVCVGLQDLVDGLIEYRLFGINQKKFITSASLSTIRNTKKVVYAWSHFSKACPSLATAWMTMFGS